MNIEVRNVDIGELELLVKWRMEVLHEVFSIPINHTFEELEKENRRYYQEALSTGEHVACFAYIKDTAVGCGGICFYREMPSPDNPTGQCAYLMNIYTRSAFRRQGVGQQIVQWLIKQALQRNISKIYLETSEAGKKLYEKFGFIEMPDMMKWPIKEVL